MNKKNKALLEKFLSILLTALLSAVITFLQTIVAEQNVIIDPSAQMTQAGIIGAFIRGGVEVLKKGTHNIV